MKKLNKISSIYYILIFILISLFIGHSISYSSRSPIEEYDIELINSLFKKNNIRGGFVDIDEWGRVELKGEYENEEEVDRAFAIAQSVVGVKWLSRVTPDRIKVRVWEVEASNAFSQLARKRKTFTPPGPLDNVYALIVGIGYYSNTKISRLPAAPRDAELIASTLHTRLNVPQNKLKIIKLINENATKDNIIKSMNFIQQNAKKDDLVFVYFATHGTPPDKDGFIRIITYDTQITNLATAEKDYDDLMWNTSLSDRELYQFYRDLEARRLVNIFDVCYSGDSLKNVPGIMHAKSRSIFAQETTNQGLSSEVMRKKFIRSRDLFVEEAPAAQAKQQAATSNDWGQIFISATGEGQKSWENSSGNGFFTYYFSQSLVNRRGDVKTSFHTAKPLVEKAVMASVREQQNPQFVSDRDVTNIIIPFK